jgi:mannose-6-phosphate isomerase class I
MKTSKGEAAMQQPVKYSADQANVIDLDTKIIYKYPTPTKQFDVSRMVIKGRSPKDADTFIYERECSFAIYIIRGTGLVLAGGQTFSVQPNDVVFIPAKNKFAMDGDFEYITFDTPAFFPEQAEEIKVTT